MGKLIEVDGKLETCNEEDDDLADSLRKALGTIAVVGMMKVDMFHEKIWWDLHSITALQRISFNDNSYCDGERKA